MVFSSAIFLCAFLPVLLVIYRILPQRYRNPLLLLASILFYAWGAPQFIFVIVGTTVIDFYLVRWMDALPNGRKRNAVLAFTVIINVALLFYFKYMNFFIENVNAVFHAVGWQQSIPWTSLALPIGISFYTFESLTYVIDVYRRIHKPQDNIWDYQLYILLFPKLIAGPIIRYHDLADQIHGRAAEDNDTNRLLGFYRFCIGLGKKVLIANVLAEFVDRVYGDAAGMGGIPPETLGAITAWMAAIAYTFQIYFDFSGYSDMAIGLGRMFGFRFPENFNNPYVATSISDFWRRWHITLGSWMRNYLYIPLGGNQVSPSRLYFNLWMVFLISGLWHGASWNFIAWGAYHGFFLVLERAFLSKWLAKLPRVLNVVYAFTTVVFGWVLFRLENMQQAWAYLGAMFRWEGTYIPLDSHALAMFGLATVFAFFLLLPKSSSVQAYFFGESATLKFRSHILLIFVSFVLFSLAVGAIAASSFNPFIYFRF